MDEGVIERYREAGRIASRARRRAVEGVREGVSVLELVESVESFIVEQGGGLAFPVNISIDDQAAHFTPSSTDVDLRFRRGQVVKIDVGAHVGGYIADTAVTVEVGTGHWSDLIAAAEEALTAAIETIADTPLGLVGRAIGETILGRGFRPVENLTGHSLDQYELHAGISVPNVERRIQEIAPPGTAVAIEPFASTGTGHVDGKVAGNIYIFRKEVRVKSLAAQRLQSRIAGWPHLPFSERQCAKVHPAPQRALAVLQRRRGIYGYPGLRDEPGSIVSQAEHTVLLLGGEVVVTTR